MLETLLSKYNVPGPRYTSYPTVPVWKLSENGNDKEGLFKSILEDQTVAIYIHIPFCERLCHFCGCNQITTKNRSRSSLYIEKLIEEIATFLRTTDNKSLIVDEIHFGGGTPNFLSVSELTKLMDFLRTGFNINDETSLSMEINPATCSKDFLLCLKTLGFNRISMGVQDFDELVQKKINRPQSYELTKDVTEIIRESGIDEINYDLIYGLPGQTMEGLAKTVDLTLGLKPGRCAVYGYAHVPWKSKGQRGFSEKDLPSVETRLAMMSLAHQRFEDEAYLAVGMDHYALESDDLAKALMSGKLHRNFMGYTVKNSDHLLGFGVSSISQINGSFIQNLKDLDSYYENVSTNVYERSYLLNNDDRIRQDLITRLMCDFKVDYSYFSSKWDINFAEYFAKELESIPGFVSEGILKSEDYGFSVTSTGRHFLRNVAMRFDAYLSVMTKGKKPVFSNSI